MRMSRVNRILRSFAVVFFISTTALPSFASNELAQTFTLDGELMLSGTTTALTDTAAVIKVEILDPSKTCLLYEEQQTVNTATSEGYFTIQIGSSTGDSKRTTLDPGLTMAQVYQNTSAVTAANAPGATCSGSTYTPAANAIRYFRVIVTPSSTNVADTLSPDTVMDAVPMATVAQTLQGYAASDFLAKAGLPTCTTGTFLSYDGTTLSCAAVSGSSGGTVTSITAGTGLTGGTITSSGTMALSTSGVTASTYGSATQVPVITVDAYGRVTSVVNTTISGGGSVSGNSGGIPYYSTATTMASSAALTQYGVVYGGGAGTAPATTAVGTLGYVLTSNGGSSAPSFQQLSLSTGVTGTLPVANGGTGAASAATARTNLGTAASGANGDITSTSVLTSISSSTSAITLAPTGSLNLSPSTAVVSSAIFEAPLGSVSAPSYTNSSSAHTGMYFPTSTSLSLATNGADALTILSGGSVGVGTTAPTGNLDIENGSNTATICLNGTCSSTLGGSSQWTTSGSSIYYNSGRVGIGTANPSVLYSLDVSSGVIGAYQYYSHGTQALYMPSFNSIALGQAMGGASASSTIAIGDRVLQSVTANYNVAVGDHALTGDLSGASNVALGYQAGYDLTSGANNIFIGAYPSTSVGITTGSNNILIGNDVRPPSQTASNQLNIGNLIYATGTSSGTTASAGNVGIGTTNPSSRLEVSGGSIVADSVANTAAYINFALGNVQVTNTSATTINVCGLQDGGAYTLVLNGITASSSVTINGYTTYGSTSSCSGAVTVDLGAGATSFTTVGNTTIVSFIYTTKTTDGHTLYGSTATNFNVK